MAPKWFLKFRSVSFSIYMLITSVIFFAYYNKLDWVQRRNDKNRIKNLKSALELEDVDFMEMVNDLKIDYDEGDLRDLEREFSTAMQTIDD